ncbi:hypothetical protein [Niallia sp. Krafla_26]|uniref:hypothetical protein n=1 Tax=Niallia sp. Krafla_26 TaxID=3064703 RepID=UPI003D185559
MSKRETMQMVSDMTDLYFGYTVEATTYFESYEKVFNWLYLSEDNPHRTLDPIELIKIMSSITIEDMQELEADTPLEYMVKVDDHTFITPKGIGYLRITK